ncbi:MAG: ankyrin repeat domain-containing protein [Bdellovibrionales bacterium]|nr:ankyrin repeat domain-containing protein [Bdellovibrionales bacterium]
MKNLNNVILKLSVLLFTINFVFLAESSLPDERVENLIKIGYTDLQYATQNCDVINSLINEEPASIDEKDNFWNTTLHSSVTNKCIDVASKLLEEGENIENSSGQGDSEVILALSYPLIWILLLTLLALSDD